MPREAARPVAVTRKVGYALMGGAKLALAVVGGYLLGRTKKMKLAIMLGGALAGKKISTDPAALLGQATKLVNASPELQRLDAAVRGRLLEAGKDAALAVASSRMEALTDSLVDRVENLGKPAAAATDAAGEAAGAAGDTVAQAGGAAGDAATVTAGAAKDTVSGAARGVRGKGRSKARQPEPEPEDDLEEHLGEDAALVDDEEPEEPEEAPARSSRNGNGNGAARKTARTGSRVRRVGDHRPGTAPPRPSGAEQLRQRELRRFEQLGDQRQRRRRQRVDERRLDERRLEVDGQALELPVLGELVVERRSQPDVELRVGLGNLRAVPLLVRHVEPADQLHQEGR